MSIHVTKGEKDLSCEGCGTKGLDMASLADYSGTFCAGCLVAALVALGWKQGVEARYQLAALSLERWGPP